jgi:hypothetical protein
MSATVTAPTASTTAQPAASKYSYAQNVNDRGVLLSTGVPMETLLGTFGPYALGSTAQIRLRNVGVITGLEVRVTATVTIATDSPTPSPMAPYNLISQVITSDYNTTQRIFASGGMMYFLNSMRHGTPYMSAAQGNQQAYAAGPVQGVDTDQVLVPTATGTDTMSFNLDVPFAVDPGNDLTGAVLAQTVVGEMFLKLQFANAAVGDAWQSPYTALNGGTTSITNIMVEVWQRYIQPQNSTLPLYDLNTVYEFAGLYQTSNNIATNGQTFVDYPNVRSVTGAYFSFVDNAALAVNGTDINTLTLVANGNTRMREQDPLLVRKHMRMVLGGDLPASLYYIPSRRNPIQTWIYSQVQELFNWATVTGTPAPYLNYAFESTYPLNTPLPGIAGASS